MLKPIDKSPSAVLNFGACLFSHHYSLAFCCRTSTGSEVFQKMREKEHPLEHHAWYRVLLCRTNGADAWRAVGGECESKLSQSLQDTSWDSSLFPSRQTYKTIRVRQKQLPLQYFSKDSLTCKCPF